MYNVMITWRKYGFQCLWENQGVVDMKSLLKDLKDDRLQDCHDDIISQRFSVYSTFKKLSSA